MRTCEHVIVSSSASSENERVYTSIALARTTNTQHSTTTAAQHGHSTHELCVCMVLDHRGGWVIRDGVVCWRFGLNSSRTAQTRRAEQRSLLLMMMMLMIIIITL